MDCCRLKSGCGVGGACGHSRGLGGRADQFSLPAYTYPLNRKVHSGVIGMER